MGKLTLVTGIPGTRIRKSLEKFASANPQRQIVVHSLETEFQSLAGPRVAEFHPGVGENPTVVQTFLLPGPLIRTLWRTAFETVIERARESSQDSDVILTLHLSFFLHSTKEYFVPADLPLLIDSIRETVDEVVTFVDDIYDVHQSLLGGSTGVGMLDAPMTLDAAVLDLMQVLDWRSVEGMLASSLAASAQKPHYVFAVKHPIETFHDLLYSEKPIIYLSHPISEPRRLFTAQEEEQAHALVNQMRGVVSRLQSSSTVIEPTAIDELRFLPGKANLSPRWPFAEDDRELLYIAPDAMPSAAKTYSFPSGWGSDERETIPSTGAVDILRSSIERQINARDHSLVEQSKKIACYRPFFDGHASRGVQEELQHFGRLVKLGLRSSDAVSTALVPSEDREAYPLRVLSTDLVPSWRQSQLLQGTEENVKRFQERIDGGDEIAKKVANGDVDALRELLSDCELTVRAVDGLLQGGALGTTEVVHRQAAETELAKQIKYAGRLYLDELAREGIVTLTETEHLFYTELEA